MPGQRNANRQGTVRNGQQPQDFAYGHVMPQAPEVEKAVLGALMIDKDAYMEVCNLLVPESFYEPRNQMVYEAIQQLSREESPVEFLHRPEYYHILQSEDGFIDYKDKAEIIIAKHRKGATGIVMMDFKGEFTRFANPEDKVISKSPREGGEIRDSGVNGRNEDLPFPQLIVTEKYEVVLSGEKLVVVEMEPLVKAVYLLFLSHPEGIVLKCLPDYRKELTSIYLLFKPDGLTKRVEKSIVDITNPTQNSINEKCARIRKLFSAVLPRSVARYYAISGKRGEAKKIDLVRANVIWKCKLPNSQGL